MTVITENMVVAMNYVLKDDTGNVLDATNGEPLEYLQGHQNIIPGLEKALSGLGVGAKKAVVVQAEEGYGEYNPELRFAIPKEQFGPEVPELGMTVQLNSPEGQAFLAQVVDSDDAQVMLDANHPLAGKALHFEVEITSIRSASSEEMTHGHPHGPHGHHH